jgi:hypothetical protein
MPVEPPELREIHRIRAEIHKETKDLTYKERVERSKRITEEVENELGIKFRRASTTERS